MKHHDAKEKLGIWTPIRLEEVRGKGRESRADLDGTTVAKQGYQCQTNHTTLLFLPSETHGNVHNKTIHNKNHSQAKTRSSPQPKSLAQGSVQRSGYRVSMPAVALIGLLGGSSSMFAILRSRRGTSTSN